MKESVLQVAMLTPWRARCGISDYSRHLVGALRKLPEAPEVQIVELAADAARASTIAALRSYASDERRFHDLGTQLNQGSDIAHIQHQYFLFGGVAPHKNHARALLNAVRVPLVLTVHEIALPSAAASPLTRAAIAATNRANLLDPRIGSYMVHTTSDYAALCALGVPAERVHRVVHGVPATPPLPDAARARAELGLEGRRVLTLFGFLSIKKGHDVALDALQHLPPDVFLLLAGDRHPDDRTDYVPDLHHRIEAMGLAQRVRITGYLPESQIPTVMAATDLAIAPYLQSSGSGSLANLLAYGRAVVASDIAPHREIANDNGDSPGLALFPSGQGEALAQQVLALLADDGRRVALQSAALAYAIRHSYTVMAHNTLAVYRTVLSCTGKKP